MKSNDELYHFGIPGMHWGQRNTAKQISKIESHSKKQGWSNDATEAAKIKTKKVNQMSNSELNKLNNRQTLEQNHSKLNPGTIKKGLAIVATTAAAIGTVTALYKNAKSLINAGKNAIQKFSNKFPKGSSASKAFWEEMKHMPR